MNDLTGTVFSKLRVIRRSDKRGKAGVIWVCGCACGNTITTLSKNLVTGNTKSCGCIKLKMMRGRTMTPITPGSQFGKLLVITRTPKPDGLKGSAAFWRVACACGSPPFTVRSDSLLQGRTTRCITCAFVRDRKGKRSLYAHFAGKDAPNCFTYSVAPKLDSE
jgi:hypothetical protein